MMSEKHATFADALAAFQADMPTVDKRHTASIRSDKGSYSYKYADLADVSAAAVPLLSRHGLAFTCAPEVRDGVTVLTGSLMHATGSVSGSLPISGRNPQEWGSWITYMRRYLLGCLTGIVTDEDEDGAMASRPAPQVVEKTADDDMITPAQVKFVGVLMSKLHMTEQEQRRAYVADVLGRAVSATELSKGEAKRLIDALQKDLGE